MTKTKLDLFNLSTFKILAGLLRCKHARYGELRKYLDISDSVLSMRLAELEKMGLIEAIAKIGNGYHHFEYRLTHNGIIFVKQLKPQHIISTIIKIGNSDKGEKG